MASHVAQNDVAEENKDSRLKQYKNVAKHEDMRRRRTECSVELRKQKRDDAFMKRRNIAAEDFDSESCNEEENLKKASSEIVLRNLTIPGIVNVLQSNPSREKLRLCFEALRRMLSRSKNAPVEEVVNSGLIVALVQALYYEDDKVRFEAAWGLTNIVSGTSEQTLAVVEQGAIAPLVELCKSPKLQVAEQSCWAVANIAGENSTTRDLVLQAGLMEALDHLFAKFDQLSVEFARTLAWVHSNLCRHKSPAVDLSVLRGIAPRLRMCLNHQDTVVRQDACWALAYLTDGSDAQIEIALDAGCVGPAVSMLRSTKDNEVAPALRVLGNFATGNDQLTQVVVDNGVLDYINEIMCRSRSQSVLKESCWLISNVIAGTHEQIDAVINANLLPLVVNMLQNGENRTRLEASWALSNLAQGGSARQIMKLAKKEYIEAYCLSLDLNNPVDILINVLETIFFTLNVLSNVEANRLSEVCDYIEEFGGLDKLEKVQHHANEKVYNTAYKIIERFFNEDEENSTENTNLAVDAHFEF